MLIYGVFEIAIRVNCIAPGIVNTDMLTNDINGNEIQILKESKWRFPL